MKADAVAPNKREAWAPIRSAGHRCPPLPSQARADGPRPDRLPNDNLGGNGLQRLCGTAGVPPVVAHRPDTPREGRVHVLPGNTLQADALKLVAKKMQSSLAVEGELPEDGLAAYGDDGDDIMMALARKIVNGEEQDDAETVEAVFAQARDAEAVAEDLLVDEGWKAVEVEPTAVETHRNGNGHAVNGVEPSVELVMGNGRHANGAGRAAAPVNGNGHHEEAAEGHQSLFSWAEFMAEEPVKPKGRKPKSQSATLSMFRVGADCGIGAGEGVGRRGTLGRNHTGGHRQGG